MPLQICVPLVREGLFMSLKPSYSEVINVAVVASRSSANLTLIKVWISEILFSLEIFGKLGFSLFLEATDAFGALYFLDCNNDGDGSNARVRLDSNNVCSLDLIHSKTHVIIQVQVFHSKMCFCKLVQKEGNVINNNGSNNVSLWK